MSWTFCYGSKRQEIIEALTLFSPDPVIRQVERGNTLWLVKQGPQAPYIVCLLLTRDEKRTWGYQELQEATGTPLNCPLELLGLAPTVNVVWRQRVAQYHAGHSKKPAVGETWSLKRARIPHVILFSVSPRLQGHYAGRPYTIQRSQLAVRLRTANVASGAGHPKQTA